MYPFLSISAFQTKTSIFFPKTASSVYKSENVGLVFQCERECCQNDEWSQPKEGQGLCAR